MKSEITAEFVSKSDQAEDREQAKHDRDGLSKAYRARNGRRSQDSRREQAQFNAVRFAVLDAIAAESIFSSVSRPIDRT